jgi:hypothetical protein
MGLNSVFCGGGGVGSGGRGGVLVLVLVLVVLVVLPPILPQRGVSFFVERALAVNGSS